MSPEEAVSRVEAMLKRRKFAVWSKASRASLAVDLVVLLADLDPAFAPRPCSRTLRGGDKVNNDREELIDAMSDASGMPAPTRWSIAQTATEQEPPPLWLYPQRRRTMSDVPKMRRPAKHSKRAMDLLGREWCGNKSTPAGVRESLYVKDDDVTRVFAMIDDGGFVGIGYPDKWQVIMRTKAARMFAWWTLRGWVADWFGLRTRLYSLALHAHVEGSWKLNPYPNQARLTTRSSHHVWRSERTAPVPVPEPSEGEK